MQNRGILCLSPYTESEERGETDKFPLFKPFF